MVGEKGLESAESCSSSSPERGMSRAEQDQIGIAGRGHRREKSVMAGEVGGGGKSNKKRGFQASPVIAFRFRAWGGQGLLATSKT